MKDEGPEHAHSTPIKTPKQLIVVITLAFVVPIIGIILLTQYITSTPQTASGTLAPEAVAQRIQPVARVVFAEAPAGGAGALRSGEEVVKVACAACHATGVVGAPKIGDKAAWADRIKQGYDTLLNHALNGIRAMPARGGNTSLKDIEVARALVSMANQSGANFKEPEAPAKEAASVATKTAPSAQTAAAAPGAPVAAPAPAAAAAKAGGDLEKGKTIYGQICMACHAAGVAGAPKFGDHAAWEPRIKTGMDALYSTALHGKGVMPPKGGNPALSDADIKAAVDYMVSAAK